MKHRFKNIIAGITIFVILYVWAIMMFVLNEEVLF